MKQRVGLACALLGAPDLLILDEPTDGFDPLGRSEFREILQQESRRGATIIINSHLLAEAEHACDIVLMLSHGRIVEQGRIADLCRSKVAWRAGFINPPNQSTMLALGFIPTEDENVFMFGSQSPLELNDALSRVLLRGAVLVGVGAWSTGT